MSSSHGFAEALVGSPKPGIWLVNSSEWNVYNSTPWSSRFTTPRDTHTRGEILLLLWRFDHAAHTLPIDLRRERVVAEPRGQPSFLCGAASPAGASRQRATHVFAACRPRRAQRIAC